MPSDEPVPLLFARNPLAAYGRHYLVGAGAVSTVLARVIYRGDNKRNPVIHCNRGKQRGDEP